MEKFEEISFLPEYADIPNNIPHFDITPIEFLIELIKNFTKNHVPLIDLDGDGFSDAP